MSGLGELVRGSILLRWSMSAEIVPIGPLETWLVESDVFWGLLFVEVDWLMGACWTLADDGGGIGGCGGPDGWVVFVEGILVGAVMLILYEAIGVSSVVLPKRSIRF
jgi:hypothetical protein